MNNRHDLPLKDDAAARFVPAIIALMVYLGTLCFVFTLFLLHSTHSWESQLTTDLTIEIPVFQGIASAPLESRVLQVVTQTPGVQRALTVSQEEMIHMFRSLIGEDVNIDSFSLPIMIDVSFDRKEIVDIKGLETHLKSISPHIQVIDHRAWQSQVSNLIHTSVFLALMITFLILLAALATTWFATRTGLLIHRQIIEVLSLIGATNAYIAKQFQINTLKHGFIASSIGSFFAFVTFFGLSALFENENFSVLLHSSFFFSALSVFILAPFVTAFLMMVSARFAVMKALNL
ncbi:MAG: hypothetical protein JSR85_01970 [Proteobacteria bacterium]|nr:hypothetical protein [Pseudomonadota bacterium]